MNSHASATVLVGFGKIGAGYADDPVMAKSIPYATHAQVLGAHDAFDWVGIVDRQPEALELAEEKWGITEAVADINDFRYRECVEVAVLATPPESRLSIIEALPNLKAVMVEKPLGNDVADSKAFLMACEARDIQVQVNMFRRADRTMVALVNGELGERIGDVQAAFGLYGNGLKNNGTHLIDLVRQLIGEVKEVQASPIPDLRENTSLPGDIDVGFTLLMESQVAVMVQPLRFDHYREVGLDLWGTSGRFSILNEGCTTIEATRTSSRITSADRELACDNPIVRKTEVGTALFDLYDNLAGALNKGAELKAPGCEALATMKIVDAIRESHRGGGHLVKVSDIGR